MDKNREVEIEVSARHVHLTKEHFKILFGEKAQLIVRQKLKQPGYFVAEQKVSVAGGRDIISNVSILGPLRKYSQVEVSLTDARKLGIPGNIRESGDIEGSPGCKLTGPNGSITLSCGVIVAKRHIHMNQKDGRKMCMQDGQIVNVKVSTGERELIFGQVVVRISDAYRLAMHIDTDEANSAGIGRRVIGIIQ